MKKNKRLSIIGLVLSMALAIVVCVSVVNPPLIGDRYALATEALSSTPYWVAGTVDLTHQAKWCDDLTRSGVPIVPAKWVERTPGIIRENEVCHGGTGGTYQGACDCIYQNTLGNYLGTVSYVEVINGTPQWTPTYIGTPRTPTRTATKTVVPNTSTTIPTFTPSQTATPSRTNTATLTSTPTKTIMPSFTSSSTLTRTATATASYTLTFTATPTVTKPTLTYTQVPSTFTPTTTFTLTPTPTKTPIPTSTPKPWWCKYFPRWCQ